MTGCDERFECMGTEVRIVLEQATASVPVDAAATRVRALLTAFDSALSRFDADSELARLNTDPRRRVPASRLMRRLVVAGVWAAARTDGLVDFTVLPALEQAGYTASLHGVEPPALADALAAAPVRRAAAASPDALWRRVAVADGAVVRPPGVRLDSGGVGKGLAADLALALLPAGLEGFVSCGGDIAVHGRARAVTVRHPITGEDCERLLVRGGIATSSICRRLWRTPAGGHAHHLIDPRTGEPAWTGLVGATALGATGLEAEALASAALLAGPLGARRVLREHGGLMVHESGDVELVRPRRRVVLRRLAGSGPAA